MAVKYEFISSKTVKAEATYLHPPPAHCPRLLLARKPNTRPTKRHRKRHGRNSSKTPVAHYFTRLQSLDLVVKSPHTTETEGQPTLFDTHRFHAFFTTSTLDTITADKTHRQRAVIEQINADLKDSALAHLPSGIFTANAAWLVLATIAFNLARAVGALTGTDLSKARSSTIRRKLISIPARISTSARRVVLHLPTDWPWENGWTVLFAAACSPLQPTTTT